MLGGDIADPVPGPPVKLDLSGAVVPVKAAMVRAAEDSSARRLKMYGGEVPCKAGCAGCCSRMIHISVAEALVILGSLRDSGDWPDVKKRCLEQRETAYQAGPVSWFKMNIPCAVLKPSDRTCSAYRVRPSVCSTHFVRSDPKVCDPWAQSSDPYNPLQMEDIHDGFMKAMASHLDGYGILAYRMPVPVALLFAESAGVVTGITLEEALRIMRTELA
jgi:Fe-S-cluster containining protein